MIWPTCTRDGWFQNDHWLSYDVSECDWFSQAHNDSIVQYDNHPVCDENNTIRKLNLNSNNLTGTLPVINSCLPNVWTLDFGNNNLHGVVPTGPSSENTEMEVFVVSNNHFEGPIISTGRFRSFGLRVIKLEGNNLTGGHGPVYRFLAELEMLNVSGNLLAGTIPLSLEYATNLVHWAHGNTLKTGTIPTFLGSLSRLETISVEGNVGLTGPIPSELGELTRLALLDVSDTNVTGPIPARLCTRMQAGFWRSRPTVVSLSAVNEQVTSPTQLYVHNSNNTLG